VLPTTPVVADHNTPSRSCLFMFSVVLTTTPSATVYNTHPRALSQWCSQRRRLQLSTTPTLVHFLSGAHNAAVCNCLQHPPSCTFWCSQRRRLQLSTTPTLVHFLSGAHNAAVCNCLQHPPSCTFSVVSFVGVFVQILNLTVIPTAVLELTAAADAELGPHLLRLTNVVGALSARRWIHVVAK
jgi:hypothetical protein